MKRNKKLKSYKFQILKNFFICISILLLLTYCENNQNIFIKNINQLMTSVSKEPFDYFDITFFKNNINEKSYLDIIYPSSIHLYGYCGIVLENNYSKTEFDSIVEKLHKKSIFKSSLIDTLKYSMLNKNKKIDDKFPIPNLNDGTNKISTGLNFNKSFILGLNKEYGKYLNDDFIKESKNNEKLNNYLNVKKNGYSNGAIIDYSSNKIIYWIIIW